jgi:hypothetical protein
MKQGMARQTFVTALCLFSPAFVAAAEPVRLQESFKPGYEYHVSVRVDLAGKLTLPPEKDKPAAPLNVTGESAIEYDERILATAADGEVERTARIYRRVDLQRKVAGRTQNSTLRPSVRRLVVMRLKNVEVPFSPDGPLLWDEIDLIRTDVFTPALNGLLGEKPVQPGDRWTATNAAVQELTDLERIEEGTLACRFDEITTLDGRRYARVSFSGAVRGVNEDGPNRQELDGYCFFDLESKHLSYVSLRGVSYLLDSAGKELGRNEGRFVLTRRAASSAKDLTDDALRGVSLEPNGDNTQLLYDNAELGVRFLYPRNWRVAGVHGSQIALDETTGSGLLITAESSNRVPTAQQFFDESRTYLGQQKAKILRTDPPRRMTGPPNEVDHFTLDADVMNQRVLMDYFIVRQAQGGATMAARVLPTRLSETRKEVERIARSVTITKR